MIYNQKLKLHNDISGSESNINTPQNGKIKIFKFPKVSKMHKRLSMYNPDILESQINSIEGRQKSPNKSPNAPRLHMHPRRL